MKSIVQELQTEEFARIRVGIGKPTYNTDLVEYVIGRKGSLGKTNAEIVKEHFPNLELATYAGLKGKGTEELKNAKYDLIFLDNLNLSKSYIIDNILLRPLFIKS